MWVFFSVLTVLLWGCSDVIFKSRADGEAGGAFELLAINGVVLGVCGLAYMAVMKVSFRPVAIVYYLPVAAAYLLSMVCYYNALPVIKLSLLSPIANCSCALVSVLCVVVLKQRLSLLQAAAIAVMVTCMALLSRNLERDETAKKTYPLGVALAFGYFVMDGIGSFLDDYALEETLTADEVFVAYAILYLTLALFCLAWLRLRRPHKPLITSPRRILGALLETAGQFTYVYAFAFGDAVLASPFIACFSVVSVLLSHLVLGEQLDRRQYPLIALIFAGMFILAM